MFSGLYRRILKENKWLRKHYDKSPNSQAACLRLKEELELGLTQAIKRQLNNELKRQLLHVDFIRVPKPFGGLLETDPARFLLLTNFTGPTDPRLKAIEANFGPLLPSVDFKGDPITLNTIGDVMSFYASESAAFKQDRERVFGAAETDTLNRIIP